MNEYVHEFISLLDDEPGNGNAKTLIEGRQHFLADILDKVGVLVVVLDLEGNIVYFNQKSERVSGYSLKEVKGKCFCTLLLKSEYITEIKLIW
ncbi:MAG: PAS domain S-box protein [Nitrospirae bacterium]|nr:PAS domain S-box protein [Nitrospirota bacterium]